MLEIYTINNYTIQKITSHKHQYPRYKPLPVGDIIEPNFTEDNTTGYFTIQVTAQYIYLLYSGKTRNEPAIDYANTIHVYDWSGRPIQRYILDKQISGFCVDNGNTKIYGLYTDPQDDTMKIITWIL
jgi:hypothetical protein